MRTLRLMFTTVAIGLLISAFQPVYAQAKGPDPLGLRPDAPKYALHGPFWVGVRSFVVAPNTDRPLKGLIWYPALNPQGLPEKTQYDNSDLQWFKPVAGISMLSPGHALKDATFDMSKAPYPLIIHSHAGWSNPENEVGLSEHLASYGFVVMTPYHTGESDPDFNNWLWYDNINRPIDVQKTIAFAENLTKSGDYKGLIDVSTIGGTGWSSGGYTALMMAPGASLDLTAFEKWCAANKDTPDAQGECPGILAHEKDMLKLAGLSTMPKGPWPSWGDPRVKGVVAFSGGDPIMNMSAVTTPLMVMTGSLETVALTNDLPYNGSASTQKARVVFANADHMIFAPKCDEIPWLILSHPEYYMVCAQAVWDMDRAHDLINHLTTAFLLDTLKGDKDAHKALLPDAVAFPGIEYQTTLK